MIDLDVLKMLFLLLKRFDYRLSLVCRVDGLDLDKLERDAMLDELEALEKEQKEKEVLKGEKI